MKNDGQFKKGFTPWNKSKKGVNGKSSTVFKKGLVPQNQRPVGFERIDSEGYLSIKVAEGIRQFRLKHHLIYEQETGEKVPKGHVLIFLDGNRLNTDFDNLVLLTRRELARLNRCEKFSSQPVEVRKSLIALVRLDIKNKQLSKE